MIFSVIEDSQKVLVTMIYKFMIVFIFQSLNFLLLQMVMMYILNTENALKNDGERS